MKTKWLLVTFGAGLPNWRAAAQRLGKQAYASGWFREVLVYDERRLSAEFPKFVEAHRGILVPKVRGFGWWIWKPFLVSKVLERAHHLGIDGVLYLDAGFEINAAGLGTHERMAEYFEYARTSGGVFAMHLAGYPERQWTRRVVIDHFGLSTDAQDAPQIQATPVLAVCDESKELSEAWLSACLMDNYALVRDADAHEPHDLSFVAHRHDQSVFSCLLKSRDVGTIPDETFWAPDWATRGAGYPLWAARNRTRVSLLDNRLHKRTVRWVEKAYSRAYTEVSHRP